MKIKITETTGIRDAKYGHLQHGQTVEVDDTFGEFAVANGWADDVDGKGKVQKGQRGMLDYSDPHKPLPRLVKENLKKAK